MSLTLKSFEDLFNNTGIKYTITKDIHNTNNILSIYCKSINMDILFDYNDELKLIHSVDIFFVMYKNDYIAFTELLSHSPIPMVYGLNSIIIDNFLLKFDPTNNNISDIVNNSNKLIVEPPNTIKFDIKIEPKKCTCGAHSVNSNFHTDWCDLYEKH
jgi:hypothetical protein